MSVKIQIASKEALERLIGGDSEIEIQIRNSVVQNFAHTHLKALAEGAAAKLIANEMGLIRDAIQKQVQEAIFESVTTDTRFGLTETKASLKDAYRKTFKDLLPGMVGEAVKEIVNEQLQASEWNKRMKEFVEMQSRWIRDEWSQKSLTARIDKLVDEKIKERLGLNS